MNRKRPNLEDVAKLAGVSPATVSAVINNRVGKHTRVSKATQKRIVEAVQTLGYIANPAARSLVGQKNRIISIFTYEPIFPLEYHNFYYPFLVGIEEEAERQGYDLLLMTSTSGRDGTRAIYRNGMNRLRLADGAILLGLSRNEQEITTLINEKFPVVFIGHREFPGVEVSYVAANYTEVTAEIVTYLVKKGHRRIVFIRDEELGAAEPGSDRETGYRLAHKILGIPITPDFILRKSPETISEQFIEHFLKTEVTAFVAETYAVGYRLLRIAKDLQREIPKDFSVTVLGGPMDSAAANVDWTTFTIPSEEMGTQAVRLLVKLLNGTATPPLQLTLECQMVAGSTVDEAQ